MVERRHDLSIVADRGDAPVTVSPNGSRGGRRVGERRSRVERATAAPTGRDRHRRRVLHRCSGARARTRPRPRPRSAPRSRSSAASATTITAGCAGRSRGAAGSTARDLAVAAEATGVALITVDARGENAIAVAPGANRCTSASSARCGHRDPTTSCCARARSRSRRSPRRCEAARHVGDVRDRRSGTGRAPCFAGAILTPNEHECEQLGGVDALARNRTRRHRDARTCRDSTSIGRARPSCDGLASRSTPSTRPVPGDAFNGSAGVGARERLRP